MSTKNTPKRHGKAARKTETARTNGGGKPKTAKKPVQTAQSVVRIRGAGFHFPEATIGTVDLIKQERPGYLFGTSMRAQIGCEKIHLAGPDDTPSSLTTEGAKAALASSNISATEIDLLLTVACTPADYDMWSLPAKVATNLGMAEAEAFGIGEVGCAGSFAAIRTALPMMLAEDGPERALIATGCLNPGHHFFPPATIFGDGAGALVLEKVPADTPQDTKMPRVVRADLYSFPHLIDAFNCGGGINLLRQEGSLEPNWWRFDIRDQQIYSELRTTNFDLGSGGLKKSLAKAGWELDSLTWLIPDNVSAKVGQEVALRLGLPLERVLTENCARYGHAFTTDLFVNLATVLETHPLKSGDRIACFGMGIGQHWGVLLLEA